MLKVEGAIVIIVHMKIFDHAHISFKPRPFCINEAVRTDRQDFLVVERAVSQPEDSYS